jgi:hypothetical protein
VAYDFVSRNCFDQGYLVVGLEVTYLLFDLSDDLEVINAEL